MLSILLTPWIPPLPPREITGKYKKQTFFDFIIKVISIFFVSMILFFRFFICVFFIFVFKNRRKKKHIALKNIYLSIYIYFTYIYFFFIFNIFFLIPEVDLLPNIVACTLHMQICN